MTRSWIRCPTLPLIVGLLTVLAQPWGLSENQKEKGQAWTGEALARFLPDDLFHDAFRIYDTLVDDENGSPTFEAALEEISAAMRKGREGGKDPAA